MSNFFDRWVTGYDLLEMLDNSRFEKLMAKLARLFALMINYIDQNLLTLGLCGCFNMGAARW